MENIKRSHSDLYSVHSSRVKKNEKPEIGDKQYWPQEVDSRIRSGEKVNQAKELDHEAVKFVHEIVDSINSLPLGSDAARSAGLILTLCLATLDQLVDATQGQGENICSSPEDVKAQKLKALASTVSLPKLLRPHLKNLEEIAHETVSHEEKNTINGLLKNLAGLSDALIKENFEHSDKFYSPPAAPTPSAGVKKGIEGIKEKIEKIIKSSPAPVDVQAIQGIKQAVEILNTPMTFGADKAMQRNKINSILVKLGGLSAVLPELDNIVKDLIKSLNVRKKALGKAEPLTLGTMYSSKRMAVEAAMNLLDKKINDTKDDENKSRLLDLFNSLSQRAGRLQAGENAPSAKEPARAGDILGRKPMGLLQAILHPFDALRQRQSLDKAVQHLKNIDIKGIELNTPYFTEDMLLLTLLTEVFTDAGLSTEHLKYELHEAMNKQLNQYQDWKQISNTFIVPDGGTGVEVTCTTTPVSNLLGNKQNLAGITISDGAGNTAMLNLDDYQPERGEERIKGINSHATTEYSHGKNIAKSELRDAGGNVIFSSLRGGTICAYGINPGELKEKSDADVEKMVEVLIVNAGFPTLLKTEKLSDAEKGKIGALLHKIELASRPASSDVDKKAECLAELVDLARTSEPLCDYLREQANFNRACETFLTGLTSKPRVLEKAKQGQMVRFGAISLITPDTLRKSPDTNERKMLKEQNEAWRTLQKRIENNEFQIKLKDDKDNNVTLKAKISAFNFGVNMGAVSKLSSVEAVSGWNHVYEQNLAAMHDLLGDPERAQHGEFGGDVDQVITEKKAALLGLISEEQTPGVFSPDTSGAIADILKEIRIIEKLASQIAAMWNNESYRVAGNEPYKMVSRIAVLSDLLDSINLLSCKSGKDRTAEAIAEAELLAFRIASSGDVPEPDAEWDDLTRAQYQEFIHGGGGFEMQTLNARVPGYKLHGVDALLGQHGTGKAAEERLAQFHGLSGYTKS